jgi:hypothetical protein
MSDDNKDIKLDLEKFKPKKPKISVPAEFLDGANSYDDKVTLVKILAEKEIGRVMLIVKKMIAQGIEQEKTKKGIR